jgi:exodeoxyribonuclease V gamma subunit
LAGLTLYTSNRLEVLASELARVLARPLPSPMEPETIVVQSRGMERWIGLELARHMGICANCRFPFPNAFVEGLFRRFFPALPDRTPFAPEIMTWKLMGLLPACLERKGFDSLRAYLGHDPKASSSTSSAAGSRTPSTSTRSSGRP